MDLMTKLAEDAFPVGGQQCAGCGGQSAGQIITRTLVAYDNIHHNIVAYGGSCGFGHIGWQEMERGGDIMGMAMARVIGEVEAMRLQDIDKKLVIIAGEGSTVTMGIGPTIHAFAWGGPFTLIIMNNEYFAQSGYHLSGRSPLKANDKALLLGKQWAPEPVPLILGLAGAKYTATATLAYPEDFISKIETALEHQPSYLEVLTPCEAGWRYPVAQTIELTRLAVHSGLYPLWEWLNEDTNRHFRITVPIDEDERVSLVAYYESQRRFQHVTEEDVVDARAWIGKQEDILRQMERAFPSPTA